MNAKENATVTSGLEAVILAVDPEHIHVTASGSDLGSFESFHAPEGVASDGLVDPDGATAALAECGYRVEGEWRRLGDRTYAKLGRP